MNYTIGEVAKILGTTASTLRFYENKGLFPFMLRNTGGVRVFDDLDINWCELLGYLKDAGMSIDTMKSYVDLYLLGDSTMEERRELVYNQREVLKAKIAKLQQAMAMIDFKCWLYDTAIEGGSMEYARNMPKDQIPPDIADTIEKMGGFKPFYLKERYKQAMLSAENNKKNNV